MSTTRRTINDGVRSRQDRDSGNERPRAWAAEGTATPDRIRSRAYEIFSARRANGAAGDALSDWLQAEREVNGSAPEPSDPGAVELRRRARGERLLASGK